MKHQRTFVFSLVMLALVALTACVQVSPEEPGAEVSIPAEAFTPGAEEIATTIEDEVVIDSTYLAENPELMVAERYTVIDEPVSASAFFATNPELMIVDRYSTGDKVTDSDFLAENLELIEARRYIILLENGPTLIRVNPESMMTGRYGNLREDKSVTDSAFYAANPELITAHRYTAALEEHRRFFPGR